MKIAITNTFLPSERPSGVPYQVHHLANALCARGHDVTVFSFSRPPVDARYTIHQLPRPPLPPRPLAFVMAYLLAVTDFSAFDVINCHGDNYLLRSTRPVVRTFHGTSVHELKSAKTLRRRLFCLVNIPLERLSAARADLVVGVSETTRTHMPAVELVIPCGVDLDAFSCGSKTEQPTVLFVGTEQGRKRGAWLAELFKKQVLTEIPSAELRMVSDFQSDEPGVRRYGRVSSEQLAELYRSSWAFCLPSTYEGFGVPYIEAMAARTAVVATAPNPGAREVLSDGEYGAFVADGDLANALKRILCDAAFREDLERRGAERSQEFGWPVIAERYERAFHAVIEAKARP